MGPYGASHSRRRNLDAPGCVVIGGIVIAERCSATLRIISYNASTAGRAPIFKSPYRTSRPGGRERFGRGASNVRSSRGRSARRFADRLEAFFAGRFGEPPVEGDELHTRGPLLERHERR